MGRQALTVGRWGANTVAAALAMIVAVVSITSPADAQTPAQDGPPLCGVEPGAGSPRPDDGELRVATFNVLHTRGDYDDETLDRRVELVGDALAAANPDVVGMQEVVSSANHGVVAQRLADTLAARTGEDWSWCFFQSNPHVPGEPDDGPGGIGGPSSQAIAGLARSGDTPWSEGVAIVSRFPITDQAAHRLPPRTAEAPVCQAEQPDNPLAFATCSLDTRQILWTRLETPCGGFDMFSSHLANDESSLSEQIRLLQITDGLAQIDQLAIEDATPDVYVGDFNTLERGPVWQAAVDAGFVDAYRTAAPDDPGFTAGQSIDDPSSTVTERIDYVFARSGSVPVEPQDGEVIGDTPAPFAGSGGQTVVWPSDHYGVVVTLLGTAACADAASAPPGPVASPATAPVPATATATGPNLARTGDDRSAVRVLAVMVAAGAALLVRRLALDRSVG